jgi:hypothetical protein
LDPFRLFPAEQQRVNWSAIFSSPLNISSSAIPGFLRPGQQETAPNADSATTSFRGYTVLILNLVGLGIMLVPRVIMFFGHWKMERAKARWLRGERWG